jgi:hypothetical protein
MKKLEISEIKTNSNNNESFVLTSVPIVKVLNNNISDRLLEQYLSLCNTMSSKDSLIKLTKDFILEVTNEYDQFISKLPVEFC